MPRTGKTQFIATQALCFGGGIDDSVQEAGEGRETAHDFASSPVERSLREMSLSKLNAPPPVHSRVP